ncbi:MAG: putative multidrug export ATP-binding/permease protein [Verrucomicrobiae bacterium]|nr:putative multidrug export ATP-binding/permease protein [Verrucomicrobiae bacterium]
MGSFENVWPQYRRLLTFVQPYRGRLVAGILFGILYGPTNVAVLSVVKKVWAQFFEMGTHEWKWWQAAGVALLLPGTMMLRGVCDFLGAYLMNWVGQRAVMDLRVRMFEQLQRLSLDYYSGTRTGELMSRVTNDTSVVQQGMANVVEDVVKEPVTLVSVLGWLLWMDWRLTLAGLVLFPVCLVPIVVYGRRTRKASKSAQQNQADLLAVLQEAIAGLRVIRAFGAEQRETDDFRTICKSFFRQRMQVARARAISTPLIELVAGAGGALVFLYAFYMDMEGSKIIAFGLGLFMLYAPVKKLSRVHLQIQETLAAGERIFQLVDEQPSVLEAATPKTLPRFSRSIEFDRVSFQYKDSAGAPVLDEVTLTVPAGALVAVVGASGAGKTTLFNMIPRFYDPVSGAVRIDGVDIREVSFQSLRAQIGLVTQETFLFNDTVAGNIAYGKPHATRAEIIEAAKSAHAHEFIEQMSQGYDTSTGDLGVKLSGGQRQRLAIARAILKNPPILLLDEATSALDSESERAVQSALDDLMWGSGRQTRPTMLVIAHRLSTVQHANQIIVLDKGRVVEQGTHDELIARAGTYKRLHDLQFNV